MLFFNLLKWRRFKIYTHFFQNIYSNHDLQRISYATCDPASKVLAFLAREPSAPLHLQHCHVFKTNTPEQAEDLNTLIGNAFRLAYASQIQDQDLGRPSSALGFNRHFALGMSQSRSADSLLSPDHDLGIIADLEPVYETPDFNRMSTLRHSTDQTFHRRNTRQFTSQRQDFYSIQMAPMQNQAPPVMIKQQSQRSRFKPNSLPVLNCLFAALSKNHENDDTILDETPYADFAVPDFFNRMNNNPLKMGSSFTQEDLRYMNQGNGQNVKPSIPEYQSGILNSQRNRNNAMNKSKSAHVISCEVYAEVADRTDLNLTTLRNRY